MHIFKRTGTASYTVRFTFQGKQYWKALDTDILSAAESRAKSYVEQIKKEKWAECDSLKTRVPNLATIGALIDCYKATNKGPVPSPRTVRHNAAKLLLVVSEALGVSQDQARLKPISILNEDLAWKFQQARVNKMTDDLDEKASAGVTIVSTLRHARGLFSQTAMMHYKAAGLKVPKISLKCPHNQLLDKDTRYVPLDPQKVAAMESASLALKLEQPELYKAYLLESRLALRASEVIAARWNWIEYGANETTMAIIKRSDFDPKGTEGRVPISDELRLELEALRKNAAPEDHILVAPSDTERRRIVERDLSTWLRTYIPDRAKTNHELRKHAVSIVLTKTKSVAHAQRFARHSSPETTMRVYGTLLELLPSVSTADWTATGIQDRDKERTAPQAAAT